MPFDAIYYKNINLAPFSRVMMQAGGLGDHRALCSKLQLFGSLSTSTANASINQHWELTRLFAGFFGLISYIKSAAVVPATHDHVTPFLRITVALATLFPTGLVLFVTFPPKRAQTE